MDNIAEILCLGNELLIGRTVNKNATDISLYLTKLGFKVLRVTTVRDDITLASNALKEIFNRNPTVVIITGGLGPTHDDIQLDVVANSTDKELQLNNEAIEMIKSKYRSKKVTLSESRKKMAKLSVNSIPLKNNVGTAPGVYLNHEGIDIFCLPGVPSEMNSIMKENVVPILDKNYRINRRMIEYGFDARGAPEADIISITDEIMEEFPSVNFKSHPRKDKTGYWLSLHTYLITDNEDIVKQACEEWKLKLQSNFDVETTEVKPIFSDEFLPE